MAIKTTTLSSKGQITLPAEIVREMKLEPGTQFIVVRTSNGIFLMPEPPSLADALAGSLTGVYGDADEYIRLERESWD